MHIPPGPRDDRRHRSGRLTKRRTGPGSLWYRSRLPHTRALSTQLPGPVQDLVPSNLRRNLDAGGATPKGLASSPRSLRPPGTEAKTSRRLPPCQPNGSRCRPATSTYRCRSWVAYTREKNHGNVRQNASARRRGVNRTRSTRHPNGQRQPANGHQTPPIVLHPHVPHRSGSPAVHRSAHGSYPALGHRPEVIDGQLDP